MADHILDAKLDGRIVDFLISDLPGTGDTSVNVRRIVVLRDVASDARIFSEFSSLYSGKEELGVAPPVEVPHLAMGPTRGGRGADRTSMRNGEFPKDAGHIEALVKKDLSRGVMKMFVPHLCVPWGRKLGRVLWQKLGLRLSKTTSFSPWCSRSPFSEASAEYNETPLLWDEEQYNSMVLEVVEKKFGRHILRKTCMNVRLDFLKEIHDGTHKKTEFHRQRIERLEEQLRSFRSMAEDFAAEEPTPCRSDPEICLRVWAVPDIGAELEQSRRYIAHGSILHSDWFPDLRRILLDKFAIDLVTEGMVASEDRVDQYLHARFNTTWTELFREWAPVAQYKGLRHRCEKQRAALQHAELRENAAFEMIRSVIHQCMVIEADRRGLLWRCALQWAQWASEENYETSLIELPKELRPTLEEARRIANDLWSNRAASYLDVP